MPSVSEQLEHLNALRNQGALTDAEFAAQKARILSASSTATRPPETAVRTGLRAALYALIAGLIVAVIAIAFNLAGLYSVASYILPSTGFLFNTLLGIPLFGYGFDWRLIVHFALVLGAIVAIPVALDKPLASAGIPRPPVHAIAAALIAALVTALLYGLSRGSGLHILVTFAVDIVVLGMCYTLARKHP